MSQDNGSEEEFEVTFGTPTLKDWKQYFRHIQKVPLNMREQTPESSEESSFELDESFEAYLNRKRKELQLRKAEEAAQAEQLSLLSHDDTMDTVKEMTASRAYGNDSTIMEADSISKISDTSFEEMERMCSIRSIVDRTGQGRNDETNETMGLDDMTQLADVEEPSGLWENSVLPVANNTVASPIKRMHLLRPSTIIEEATINETSATSKNTSAESFVTAKQSQPGRDTDNYSAVTGSEIYRTADDMSVTEPSMVSSTVPAEVAYDQTTMGDDESSYGKNSTREADSTFDVIDRDRSHERSDETAPVDSTFNDVPEDKASHWETITIEEEEESLLECSLLQDDEVKNEEMYEEEEEQSVHQPQPLSPMLDAIPDHFNDTLEEIDFMMRQGLKLKAMKQQQKEAEFSSEAVTRPATIPIQPNVNFGVASKLTPSTPFSPNRYLKPKHHAVASNSCKQTLFGSTGKANHIHPGQAPSSTGSFKKPLSRLPILKSAKKYDHIVSPIGAYINKTPKNTLQAKIHCPSQNLIDVLSNRSVRESRVSVKENYSQEAIDTSSYISSIPRKGVISSSRAHVLDERSTLRIPGGEKVRKLFNNSPTMVIRHEGRLKYVDEPHGSKGTRATLGDDSLADLSTISGDISVRVLKDAKRF